MHLKHAADALFLALDGVDDVGACLKLAGVDAQVGELADEGVGHDFERQSCERSFGVGRTGVGLAGIRIGTLDGLHVNRGRQVVDDGVEQLLNTLVLVGGTDEDGVQTAGQNAGADGSLELVDGDFLLHEDLLHEVVVEVGGGVEEFLMVELSVILELSGDLVHGLGVGHALVVGLEVPCSHGDQVDDAPEVVLSAHGQLSGNGVSAQTILHGLDGMHEVGAHAVVLVDERDTGNAVALGLTPNGLGLRLNACDGVEDRNGAIENAQGTLDLSGEVDVARGVDDLEAVLNVVLSPEASGSCGGNGNAALLFLNHPVHGGCAFVDLTDLVGLTGVVEDALGSGGFTGIDVSHDAEVTSLLEGGLLSHC